MGDPNRLHSKNDSGNLVCCKVRNKNPLGWGLQELIHIGLDIFHDLLGGQKARLFVMDDFYPSCRPKTPTNSKRELAGH